MPYETISDMYDFRMCIQHHLDEYGKIVYLIGKII